MSHYIKRGNEYLESEIERLQDELEKYRWIPVSERLPDKTGSYLTIMRFEAWPKVRRYNARGEKWDWQEKVTHWKLIILPEGE